MRIDLPRDLAEALDDLVRRGVYETPEAAVLELLRLGIAARGERELVVSADTSWG